MSHTQITHTSFAGNLIAAIAGVGLGIVLFLGSFLFLFWNEGRLDVSTIAKKALVVAPDGAGGAGEGSVISVTAGLATEDKVGDPDFLVPAVHVSVRRKAEMYSWVEDKKTEEKKKLGGGSEKITTYDYRLVWSEEPKDSSAFEYSSHENPPMAVRSESFFAGRARVGAFEIVPKDIELPPGAPLALTDAALVPLAPHAKPELAKLRPRRDGSYVYLGAGTPGEPVVGDVRVSFAVVDPTPGPVTLYGVRKGSGVVPWIEPDKLIPEKLFRVVPGTHEQAIALLHGEHTMSTWIFRAVGFMAMWIGLTLLVAPFNAVLDVVPFVGKAGRFMTTLVMFPIALVLSLLTIVLGILAHHPVLLLIPVAVAVIVFVAARTRRRAAATASLALMLLACGSGVPCKERAGTYDVKYTVRGGNCGSIPQQTVTIGGDAGAGSSACAAKPTVSADNCSVTVDTSCPDGTTSHGTITWDASGSSATGALQLTSPICTGTYDVTYTRR